MAEHRERHAADGALRHAHEHHVAQLGEQHGREAQHAIGDEQRQRQRQYLLRGRKRIDDGLQQQRHTDVGELGRDEE